MKILAVKSFGYSGEYPTVTMFVRCNWLFRTLFNPISIYQCVLRNGHWYRHSGANIIDNFGLGVETNPHIIASLYAAWHTATEVYNGKIPILRHGELYRRTITWAVGVELVNHIVPNSSITKSDVRMVNDILSAYMNQQFSQERPSPPKED